MLIVSQLTGFNVVRPPWQSVNDALGTTVTMNSSDKSSNILLSGGDLTVRADTQVATHALVRATDSVLNHRVYFEVQVESDTAQINIFGMQSGGTATNTNVGGAGQACGMGYASNASLFYAAGWSSSGSPTDLIDTEVFGVAYDAVEGKCWIRDSGGYLSGDPDTGESPSLTRTAGNLPLFPAASLYNSAAGIGFTFNFGASAFSYSVPTG